jgi:ribonucleoside-triphosphate reductase
MPEEKVPFYTNSSQLPVGFTDDLFEAVKLQEPLQTKFTGGTVFHTFLGEKITASAVKTLLKKVFAKSKMPYLSISPTFSVCPQHGYINGEHFKCPDCDKDCEVYARVVGYIRPVKQWNKGKVAEYHTRKVFKV